MSKITVKFADGQTKVYEKGTDLLTISADAAHLYKERIVAAEVDKTLKNLKTKLNNDCTVEFLELSSAEGIRVYDRTAALILITAAHELFPGHSVTIEHSISHGVFCELHIGRELTLKDVESLEERMRFIIKEDRPIVRTLVAKEEAIEFYTKNGCAEKVSIINQLDSDIDKVDVYSAGGAYSYFYGPLMPSSGYVSLFELKFLPPGFILRGPAKEDILSIPEYIAEPKLTQIFEEAEKWGKILDCGYVGILNEHIKDGHINHIIRVAEALHEKKVAQIADFICQPDKDIKVILIAGPSSSGKTTFAQRLMVQLRVNGVRPASISLDDYFVDREQTPRDEEGNYDFESIESIDLDLFNEHLVYVLQGKEVKLPTYNFMNGQREYRGHTIKIDPYNQPVIIEGIHGLNERLSQAVERRHKVKIYISAITQMAIDSHNRIPTTDTRLIRRIVRDSQFRAHDAFNTLSRWPSVRRGEKRNIFPYQEEADIMFNSALIYELGVLKRYAEPLLEKVTSDYPEYREAQRLLTFLEYFQPIDDSAIPQNSLLREFLGQSCFA